MATTCLIVRKTDDGEYQHILCHHDGQIDNGVGDRLINHYNDVELVAELFDLGDLSRLGTTLDPGDTMSYYRDLGEEWENVVAGDSRSLALLPEEPFVYLFENDGWKYRTEAREHFRPIPDKQTRRKLAMIKNARENADRVQERRVIYESDCSHPPSAEDIDGMENLLGDDVLDTDWDIAIENPIREGFDGDKPHPDKPAGREKLAAEISTDRRK
jgi:hypothetical protein